MCCHVRTCVVYNTKFLPHLVYSGHIYNGSYLLNRRFISCQALCARQPIWWLHQCQLHAGRKKLQKNISFSHNCHTNCVIFQGYTSKKEFIAAQGPLPCTVNDFWRLIWEKNVQTIVMLTKCNEQGRVQYILMLHFICDLTCGSLHSSCFIQFYCQIRIHVFTSIFLKSLNRLATTYSKLISSFRFSSLVLNFYFN